VDFSTYGLLDFWLYVDLAVSSVSSFVMFVMNDTYSYFYMVGTPIRSDRLGSGNTGGGLPVGSVLSLRMLEGLLLFCCALPTARGRTGIGGGVCSEVTRAMPRLRTCMRLAFRIMCRSFELHARPHVCACVFTHVVLREAAQYRMFMKCPKGCPLVILLVVLARASHRRAM
jgi:hypothetical protein